MSGLRKRVTMGLVLLMCTLTGHCGESAPSSAPSSATAAWRDARKDLRRMLEIVSQVEHSRGRHSTNTATTLTSRMRIVFPRDLRKKEKFLKHITGPLYFSPKCRKHVYRLYHHTRDCTIPAYFKRCARLLTRLAGSPQCTEG
uniref:ALK and LTK ligand 2a n=1 Tax=Cyclopterus lumpus TaxID=8103 RepID=A0A8C2Z5W7_CYCLU